MQYSGGKARLARELGAEYEAPAGWAAIWSKGRRMDMRDTAGDQKIVRENLYALECNCE